eukprot:m.832114 g.832114  ORF g.832114 m.832114 type:complete len:63 (-) comp23432_c1_seq1:28-216(-)
MKKNHLFVTVVARHHLFDAMCLSRAIQEYYKTCPSLPSRGVSDIASCVIGICDGITDPVASG